jgi:hypothetical protein
MLIPENWLKLETAMQHVIPAIQKREAVAIRSNITMD